MSIYYENSYKKHQIIKHDHDAIEEIVLSNSFGTFTPSDRVTDEYICNSSLFGMISFLNHGRQNNLWFRHIGLNLYIIGAARDIKAGEELLHDYVKDTKDPEERNKRLAFWGIKEEIPPEDK